MVSAYLPFYCTAITMAVSLVIFLVNLDIRKTLLAPKGIISFYIFTILSSVVSVAYENWLGLGCSFGLLAVLVISISARQFITRSLFETVTHIACVMSVVASSAAIFERLINFRVPHYRSMGYCNNPNYLATLLGMSVLICAYKVIYKNGNRFFYYSAAVICGAAIYCSGSMFIWAAVFIGVSALLILAHEHQLLSIFLMIATLVFTVLFFSPDLFPRLSESFSTTENRFKIWELALAEIRRSPVFGRGFFSYLILSKETAGSYIAPHTHNLLIDSLLNHGIVGSLVLFWYFLRYYITVAICHRANRNSKIIALIIGMTAAVLLYSIVDMTILWVQTGLLGAIIMSGLKIEEVRYNHTKMERKM